MTHARAKCTRTRNYECQNGRIKSVRFYRTFSSKIRASAKCTSTL